MTLCGLVLRFTIAYVFSLILGLLMAFYFANQSVFVITTAALLASTFYVCHAFCRRNMAVLSRGETGLAWVSFLLIDFLLQAGMIFLSVGSLEQSRARLQQFIFGELLFVLMFHGVCIYAFIRIAEKVAAKHFAAQSKTPAS